jgi:hypothetical protein
VLLIFVSPIHTVGVILIKVEYTLNVFCIKLRMQLSVEHDAGAPPHFCMWRQLSNFLSFESRDITIQFRPKFDVLGALLMLIPEFP